MLSSKYSKLSLTDQEIAKEENCKTEITRSFFENMKEFLLKYSIFILIFILSITFISILLVLYHSNYSIYIKYSVENINPIKQFSDNNKYRYIQLTNKMKILLISNNEGSGSSGLSLSVNVGSIDEPDNVLGKKWQYLINFLNNRFYSKFLI